MLFRPIHQAFAAQSLESNVVLHRGRPADCLSGLQEPQISTSFLGLQSYSDKKSKREDRNEFPLAQLTLQESTSPSSFPSLDFQIGIAK